MGVLPTALPGVLLMNPQVWTDARGFFLESWNESTFRTHWAKDAFSTGQPFAINAQRTARPALPVESDRKENWFDVRAVRCLMLRSTFGGARRVRPLGGCRVIRFNHHMLWIPPGFGHGFLVLSEEADVFYKTSELYDADSDRAILWNDADLAIKWPLVTRPSFPPRMPAAPTERRRTL